MTHKEIRRALAREKHDRRHALLIRTDHLTALLADHDALATAKELLREAAPWLRPTEHSPLDCDALYARISDLIYDTD